MSIFTFIGGTAARSQYQLERDIEDAMETANVGWQQEHDENGHHTDITCDSIGTRDGEPLRWSSGLRFIKGPITYDEASDPSITVAAIRSTITASQNNWAPNGINECVIVEVSSTSAVNITGIYQHVNIRRDLRIVNRGSYAITLKHQSSSSQSAFRFYFPGTSDYVLQPGDIANLYYDPGSALWRAGRTGMVKSIQEVDIQITSGNTSNTATITAVTTSKCVLVPRGASAQISAANGNYKFSFNNSTTVVVSREGTGETITYSCTVLEFL